MANQNGGTVSVIDLGKRAVIDTLQLAANARPQNVRVIPPGGMLAVTEPDAGVIDLFDLPGKARYTARMVATDVVFQQTNAYITNQIGGAASAAAVTITPGGIAWERPAAIALDPGLRGAAVDPLDNLLLVSSESSGTVVVDRSEQQPAGGQHQRRTRRRRNCGATIAATGIAPATRL